MSDTVYQYFTRSGRLIYVGVTSRGIRRSKEHAETKAWWPEATGCRLEHFDRREDALRRERDLIERHRPPYNTTHNPEAGSTHNLRRRAEVSLDDDVTVAWKALPAHAKRRMCRTCWVNEPVPHPKSGRYTNCASCLQEVAL